MKQLKTLFFILFSISVFGQRIPNKKIITVSEISNYLIKEVQHNLSKIGIISTKKLASYFREKFSERYFYDYKTVDKRFAAYSEIYPKVKQYHTTRGLDHFAKYPAKTAWKLPFKYQNGQPVNAYALRHLARQHKMIDIAFYYFYQQKNTTYLNYFKEQLQSLNTALKANKFEIIEDGNGVYEAFRSGYRVLNWLQIHNLFLGETAYSDEDQLTTIATLLQHGSYLFDRNQQFKSGNHQTRGLSALAMLSILLRDFVDTDVWYKHSMNLLAEHLRKEINEDGFQFERTIHYHISDIGNYFYVYQLAKNSHLKVDDFWKNKLESLFTTLTKIAFPDKSAPVLSDDTDTPWAEKNDISEALTLGYLLFEKPSFGYFANNKVSEKIYWYVSSFQLESLKNIKTSTPNFNSYSFPKTGYYIMRQGWNKDDKMIMISAGLDALKPDHQHGDMLGIQAMANGQVILPNYQVRYSLQDLELFKNSMVKNVALVDDELQGKKYTSNKGGSGFGKFKKLPNPKVIAWKTNEEVDFFVGSHDGFENIGVKYSRQIFYLKDDFWIVKDNFYSDKPHTYKQVWQGHYSLEESSNLIRATFDDASGFDIYQLKQVDSVINSGQRGKQWSVISKKNQTNFSFITVLFPYKGYLNRIDETSNNPKFKDWKLNNSMWKVKGNKPVSLSKENKLIFFSVSELKLKDTKIEFSKVSDVFVELKKDSLIIQSLNEEQTTIFFNNKNFIFKSGQLIEFQNE